MKRWILALALCLLAGCAPQADLRVQQALEAPFEAEGTLCWRGREYELLLCRQEGWQAKLTSPELGVTVEMTQQEGGLDVTMQGKTLRVPVSDAPMTGLLPELERAFSQLAAAGVQQQPDGSLRLEAQGCAAVFDAETMTLLSIETAQGSFSLRRFEPLA